MSEIIKKLEESISEMMMPEVDDYISEINEIIKNKDKSQTLEDIEALENMYTLKEELQTILNAIIEDKITDIEAKEIYEKIEALMDESKNH